MLERSAITSALIRKLEFSGGKPKVKSYLARTPDEIREAQGSIYLNFPQFTQDVIAMIRNADGPVAVTALPCGVATLRKLCARDELLKTKIGFVLGLFCGHTSRPELLEKVLIKKGIDASHLQSFRFGKGLWRGHALAVLNDGTEREWPTAYYKLYQNLFVLPAPQCLNCTDHFAEFADVFCGDVWIWKHRHDSVKNSIFVSRTELGERVLSELISAGKINAESASPYDLYRANRRAVVYHKPIRARAAAFARHGVELRVPVDARAARWNERLAAELIALLSQCNPGRVLKTNRRLLKAVLYLFKGLTNF